MCLMGDMKRDFTWYSRAWEESGGKCAKAMRYLGRYYFDKGEFDDSIVCYEKALVVNKLYPDAWFTLGCAYMKISDFKNGAYSFAQVVSIDDRNTEAWANTANCYVANKRYFEAVTCCEQALKGNRKAFKIWNNYILFSIETLQFYKAMGGVKTLLRYS